MRGVERFIACETVLAAGGEEPMAVELDADDAAPDSPPAATLQEPATMPRPGLPVLRGVRRTLGTAAARIYLAGCALLLGWALVTASDGSVAAVVPVFATVPSSLVLLLLLPEGGTMFLLSIVLGALINAVVIGWCARALRRGSTPDTAS